MPSVLWNVRRPLRHRRAALPSEWTVFFFCSAVYIVLADWQDFEERILERKAQLLLPAAELTFEVARPALQAEEGKQASNKFSGMDDGHEVSRLAKKVLQCKRRRVSKKALVEHQRKERNKE